MSYKFIPLTKLLTGLICASKSGRRRTPDDCKIRKSTIANYMQVLKKIDLYSAASGKTLKVPVSCSRSPRIIIKLTNQWLHELHSYKVFMHNQGSCDNHVASHVRIIRTCLNWARIYRGLQIPQGCVKLHAREEEIEVLALTPIQLQFLLTNDNFDKSLPDELRIAKRIFVVGCHLGLRFTDLLSLRKDALTHLDNSWFINVKTRKTGAIVSIPVSILIVGLLNSFNTTKTMFPKMSLSCFNNRLKLIGEAAGWKFPVSKIRSKSAINKGRSIQTSHPFNECLSSHIMRRTAISLLLSHGVPELLVRQITGHKLGSSAFYKYVNFNLSHSQNIIEKAWMSIVHD